MRRDDAASFVGISEKLYQIQYFWIKATVANDKEKMKTRTVNFGPLRSCSCLWSKFESTLPIFWTEKLNQKLEEGIVYLLTH